MSPCRRSTKWFHLRVLPHPQTTHMWFFFCLLPPFGVLIKGILICFEYQTFIIVDLKSGYEMLLKGGQHLYRRTCNITLPFKMNSHIFTADSCSHNVEGCECASIATMLRDHQGWEILFTFLNMKGASFAVSYPLVPNTALTGDFMFLCHLLYY